MSDALTHCACGEPLRPNANFCVVCGLEVRPLCPACNEERRPLATLVGGQSPWCEKRSALLYACENCGRWLLPGVRLCPNPDCAYRVLPSEPQHTARRRDGRGSSVGWNWPVGPRNALGQMLWQAVRWQSGEPVHAVFVAHGRLYVWTGNNVVVPEERFSRISRPEAGRLRPEAGGKRPEERVASAGDGGEVVGAQEPAVVTEVLWRTSLGTAIRPSERVPFAERVAIAGAGAVLASDRVFVLVGLNHRSDFVRMETGVPLAQAGGPAWWVGWSEENGTATLRYGAVEAAWDRLRPQKVETPPEAALAGKGRVTLRDHRAYWPGQDGAVWQLDCETGTVSQAVSAVEGLRQVWAEPDGPRLVYEMQGRLNLGLGTPQYRRMPLDVPAGMGPLRDVFATPDYAVVVGERALAFDARTGERLHESNRAPGRWIGGALAGAADGEPRLLALTQEGERGRLSGQKVSSGVEELLWFEAGYEPVALLAVADSLIIAHSRGVVRLTERA